MSAGEQTGHMRSVLIPVFDGVQSLDVTGPLEAFTLSGGYEVRTASLGGGAVRTSSGPLAPFPLDDRRAACRGTRRAPGLGVRREGLGTLDREAARES